MTRVRIPPAAPPRHGSISRGPKIRPGRAWPGRGQLDEPPYPPGRELLQLPSGPLAPFPLSALVALLLGGGNAAPLAYLSGTLGTLIGADLLNLGRVEGLGAPVVSIGGAGTFDGIFLTGVFSVLLV